MKGSSHVSERHISQNTFDEIVKENMEDFEMTLEDAINDAKTQFQTQGVNLSNIMMGSGVLSTSGNHPLICLLHKLEKLISLGSLDTKEVLQLLRELKNAMSSDDENKTLIGKNGGVEMLLCLLKPIEGKESEESTELTLESLKSLTLLCHKHADNRGFVREHGVESIINVFSLPEKSTSIQMAVLKCLKSVCSNTECNKKILFSKMGPSVLLDYLLSSQDENHVAISKLVANLLRILTINDDPTSDFSQVHEVVRRLVEHKIFDIVMNELNRYSNLADIVGCWLIITKQLAITEDNCKTIVEYGILQYIQSRMFDYQEHAKVLKYSIGTMRNVAAVDRYKAHLVETGGLGCTLKTMDLYPLDASIQEQCCATIAAMCLRQPELCPQIVESGAVSRISKVLISHIGKPSLMRAASLAIRNMVSRNPELRETVLEDTIEEPLREAIKHRSCGDEAYAALRDLGCDVRLYENSSGPANFNPTYKQSNELLDSIDECAEAPFKK